VSVCRSCGAEIRWSITETGKRIPLDPDPSPTGNIRLDFTTAHVLRADDDYQGPRYVSHFATCPNASAHRRR
jgi:hypothetical protein